MTTRLLVDLKKKRNVMLVSGDVSCSDKALQVVSD